MMHTHHESQKTREREQVRGLKSLNSHSIENEAVRIYHSNSGKSILYDHRQYLRYFVAQRGYDLLGPNSFLVLGHLQLLRATTSCNSRERLAVRDGFPQGG